VINLGAAYISSSSPTPPSPLCASARSSMAFFSIAMYPSKSVVAPLHLAAVSLAMYRIASNTKCFCCVRARPRLEISRDLYEIWRRSLDVFADEVAILFYPFCARNLVVLSSCPVVRVKGVVHEVLPQTDPEGTVCNACLGLS
jgi:hypothetical protein